MKTDICTTIPERFAASVAQINATSRAMGLDAEVIGIRETLFRGDDMNGERVAETHFIRRADGVYSVAIWRDFGAQGLPVSRVDNAVKVS